MFLDIGVGIFLAIIMSFVTNRELTPLFILMGIFAALSPDLDYLVHIAKGGTFKDDHRHRDLIHKPIPFIGIGSLILYFISPTVATMFAVGALCHFVHDSIGIGWGVQWLYPFSSNHYSFLYLYQPQRPERLPRRWLYSWKHEDIDTLNDRYGDEDWVRNIYLKVHPYGVIEMVVLILAIFTLVIFD